MANKTKFIIHVCTPYHNLVELRQGTDRLYEVRDGLTTLDVFDTLEAAEHDLTRRETIIAIMTKHEGKQAIV